MDKIQRNSSGNLVTRLFGKMLPDIRVGDFQASIAGSSTSPTGVTYVGRTGIYVRIGQVVFIWVGVAWSAATGGTGTARIVGFPFTIAATGNFFGSKMIFPMFSKIALSANYSVIGGDPIAGSDGVTLYQSSRVTSDALGAIGAGNFSDGTYTKELYGFMVYITDSK